MEKKMSQNFIRYPILSANRIRDPFLIQSSRIWKSGNVSRFTGQGQFNTSSYKRNPSLALFSKYYALFRETEEHETCYLCNFLLNEHVEKFVHVNLFYSFQAFYDI